MMSQTIVKMEGISKAFAGIKALDNVQIDLRQGEIHALMGENGAGKSTLMKIMTGVYSRDSWKDVSSECVIKSVGRGRNQIPSCSTEIRTQHGISGV